MTKAKNKVISGAYAGKNISCVCGSILISTSFGSGISIDKTTVENIEVVDSESKKDTGSCIARGIVGGLLLGPVGVLGGAVIGKTNDIHILSIQFKNNEKSLIEIDGKIYK